MLGSIYLKMDFLIVVTVSSWQEIRGQILSLSVSASPSQTNECQWLSDSDTQYHTVREGERERETESIRAMAASQFAATRGGAETVWQCKSQSKLIDFSSRKNKSKLLFTTTNLNQRRSFSFSVKNASSEPSQKLKDPIVEQGSHLLVSLHTLFFNIHKNACF